jgi:hypothetical protein
MTIDPKIREAIESAVADAGQDTTLAPKLIRWFEAIASGSEQINDRQSAYRHLELLYETTQPPAAPDYAELEKLLGEMDEPEEES